MPDTPTTGETGRRGGPAQELLVKEGHILRDGRCVKCWSEAATLYAMGQGPYDSHNDAYYATMRAAEERAERAVYRRGQSIGRRRSDG